MQVFISWRGKDAALKNEIVAAIRAGIPAEDTVWESDEGCVSDAVPECMKALAVSSVFVLLLTEAAMEDSYCIPEMKKARELEMSGQLNMLLYQVTDKPLSDEVYGYIGHISDANRVARLNNTQDGKDELVRRINVLLERRKNGTPEKPFIVHTPEIIGTGLSDTGYFVENSRNDIFEQLDEAFARSNVVFTEELDGYGKRSAVRKYVRLHADEYQTVKTLNSFSGSLREVFTRGLHFGNINESVFEGLSEQDLILKKASFLKLLTPQTMLIVPGVVIDDKEDNFIYDVLSDIGCRMVIVSQSVPDHVKSRLPVVHIGRMQDQYLSELFFHFYRCDQSEEREALGETLQNFFNVIAGHTKSVEIMSQTLAREIGVYPEDIPEIVQNLGIQSENRLAAKIFKLISQLFEINQFSDTEKKILMITALVAQFPLDEQLYAEFLQENDCCDTEALETLVKNRWVTRDRRNRTVEMEPFLADICLSKNEPDEETAAICIEILETRFFSKLTARSMSEFRHTLLRLKRLFEALHLRPLAHYTDLLWRIQADDATVFENTEHIFQMAHRCVALRADGPVKDAISDYLDTTEPLVRSLIGCMELSRREGNTDLFAEVSTWGLKQQSILDSLQMIQDTTPDSEQKVLFADFVTAVATGNSKAILMGLLQILDCATALVKSEDEETADLLEDLLIHLTASMICYYENIPYACLQLARKYRKLLADLGYDGYSYAQDYLVDVRHLDSLCTLKEVGESEEAEQVFASLLYNYKQAKKELFDSDENAIDNLWLYASHYINALCDAGLPDEAREAFEQVRSYRSCMPAVAQARADTIESIFNAYLTDNRIGDGVDAMRDIIAEELRFLAPFKNAADAPEAACDTLESLAESVALLSDNTSDTIFADAVAEYRDYYKSFENIKQNRKKMAAYMRTAEAAAQIHFDNLSNEQLAETADELRRRALSGTPREKLAPEAFALVSEAGYRVLGYRHHYVQYIGAAAIADGNIAEIQNGEGKTYTIIPAAFLHALYGKQVHIVDYYAYLTERNYKWMAGVLRLLGCRVGLLNKHVDSNELLELQKCDIIYGSMDCEGFAYARKTLDAERPDLRYDVAIADEADYLLFDMARRSVQISDSTASDSRDYMQILRTINALAVSLQNKNRADYFTVKNGYVQLKAPGIELLHQTFRLNDFTDDPAFSELLQELFADALTAYYAWERDKDYHVRDGEIKIEDLHSGMLQNTNSAQNYFLCLREGLRTNVRTLNSFFNAPLEQVSYIEFLDCFSQICGTTATARSLTEPFKEVYQLDIVLIPPNKESLLNKHKPQVYTTINGKLKVLLNLVFQKHREGQPVLVITETIRESQIVSKLLTQHEIEHQLLNALSAKDEARILSESGKWGAVTVGTALVNRGVDILLGGNPYEMAKQRILTTTDATPQELESAIYSNNQSDLRDSYYRLVNYYRNETEAEKEKVIAVGGLCVIGTKCFDDLRNEQQARGRAGRQGAVGESYILFSIEDESVRKMMGKQYPRVQALLNGLPDDCDVAESRSAGILTKSIDSVRKKILQNKFDRLKSIPERVYFPRQRAKLKHLTSKLLSGETDVDELIVSAFSNSRQNIEEYRALLRGAVPNDDSPLGIVLDKSCQNVTPSNAVSDKQIPSLLESVYRSGISVLEERGFDHWTRSIFVGKELYRIWSVYLSAMKKEIDASYVLYTNKEKQRRKYLETFSEERFRQCTDAAINRAASRMFQLRVRVKTDSAPQSPPSSPNVTRIGPNDACPCGSGLKYKQCHGKMPLEDTDETESETP